MEEEKERKRKEKNKKGFYLNGSNSDTRKKKGKKVLKHQTI